MKICDFTKPELDFLVENCNFTKDEREIFDYLSCGYTSEEIAELCNMSVSTMRRIKNKIRAKIERLQSL